MVHCLRLCASNAGCVGLIPGKETIRSHVPHGMANIYIYVIYIYLCIYILCIYIVYIYYVYIYM